MNNTDFLDFLSFRTPARPYMLSIDGLRFEFAERARQTALLALSEADRMLACGLPTQGPVASLASHLSVQPIQGHASALAAAEAANTAAEWVDRAHRASFASSAPQGWALTLVLEAVRAAGRAAKAASTGLGSVAAWEANAAARELGAIRAGSSASLAERSAARVAAGEADAAEAMRTINAARAADPASIVLPARGARDASGRIVDRAADLAWQAECRRILTEARGAPFHCVATVGEMISDLRASGRDVLELA